MTLVMSVLTLLPSPSRANSLPRLQRNML